MVSHCGQARFMWNLAVEQMHTARSMGLRADIFAWERQLTELRNTEGFEWLAAGACSIQQQALRQLRQALRNHWSNPSHFRFPRFRSKQRTRDGFVVSTVTVKKLNRKWSSVRVPKVGYVKFRRTRPLGEHGMAHVTRDRQGRWHVSFAAPQPAVDQQAEAATRAVGIDRGVTDTIATSDGEQSSIPVPTKQEVQRHTRLQRRRARQAPGSNRRARTKQAIAKLEGRWADRRKDWVEQTSTRLVANYSLIVFEDLNVAAMMRSASGTIDSPGVNVAAKQGLNHSIAQSAWGMLQQRTRDKAEASGVEFVTVPAAYTSQRCAECGHTDRSNRTAKRFECVECGHSDDADINAAKNILAARLVVSGRGEHDCVFGEASTIIAAEAEKTRKPRKPAGTRGCSPCERGKPSVNLVQVLESARVSPILGERRRVRLISASSSGVNSRCSKSAAMASISSPGFVPVGFDLGGFRPCRCRRAEHGRALRTRSAR